MKRKYAYLVALMFIVDSQVATGESPRTRQDESRASSQFSEDIREKKLLNFLKSADPSRVSYLLAESKKVTIWRGKAGQLRVLVGDVSAELLTTKINLVSFKTIERYNAIDAINAITRTKEIQAKLGEARPATAGNNRSFIQANARSRSPSPSFAGVDQERDNGRGAGSGSGDIRLHHYLRRVDERWQALV